MNVKPGWKALLSVMLVLAGGLAAIFACFVLAGFPFRAEAAPYVLWSEAALLLLLLIIPLFR